MVKKQRQTRKKKKKVWVSILAPKDFNNIEVGETQVYDVEKVIGKRILSSMSFLIKDPKKQNIKVLLSVKEVKENKALTEIIGFEVISANIKRLSKISKGKVERSLKFKTKDGVDVVIKTATFIKNKTPRKVLTSIRKRTEELLNEEVKKRTYEDLAKDIIFFKLQKKFYNELKKIIPISTFLVRKFQKSK